MGDLSRNFLLNLLSCMILRKRKKGMRFDWPAEHQAAFDCLKQALSSALVFQIPDFDSDRAISAVLHQRVGENLAPTSYRSRVLSPAERQYSVYEKCLAVLFGCEKARSYLERKEFELHCDNLAVLVAQTCQRCRSFGLWILLLSPFKFSHPHTKSRRCGWRSFPGFWGTGFPRALLHSLPRGSR